MCLSLIVPLPLVAFASCGGDNGGTSQPQPTNNASIERVAPSGTRTGEILSTKTVTVDNCYSSAKDEETLGAEETIKVSIEKIDDQTLSVGGTVNIGTFGSVNVGEEISSQYGVTYGEERKVSDSRTVTVEPGKSVVYKVEVRARYDTGRITITDGAHREEFPYEILTGVEVVANGTDQGCSFLGEMQGTWSLREWRERSGQVTLGMSVRKGSLVVDEFGHAYWDLELDSGRTQASGPVPGLRCVGELDETAKVLAGVTTSLKVNGAEVKGDQRDWDGNLRSLRNDALVAWCGWTFGQNSDLSVYDTTRSDYKVTLTTAGDQDHTLLLTMKNAAGTFTWERKRATG
jgi:hypothetical protein